MKPKQSLLSGFDYQADHYRRQDFLLLKFHDLPSRKRGRLNEGGVCARTTSRGFCDAGPRGFLPVTRSRPLPVLAQYATDRPAGPVLGLECVPVWKRVSMGGCNKGSVHTRISELYCIIAIWNE
ncbi:unnamed protein product [Sphagnum troendelagicum]|uniref:Uncharacterized protein n=1 Tax=Sphagnum troendelagicum TaxID=128251 RepID=A0ABP0UT57_9BRYO